jgi:hypothetical protein
VPRTKMKEDYKTHRQIVSGFLIVGSCGPLMMTVNKDKAVSTFAKVKAKDPKSFMTSITVHAERFKQIGENLIKRKLPEGVKDCLMRFRNTLVVKTHQCDSWEKVRREYSLPEITYDEMSQWLLDHMKYHTREMD